MLTTTPEYDAAIVGNPRKTASRVVFEIIDVTAADDATPSATSEASISRIEQVIDEIKVMSGKYATNENDYTLLDGSYTLPPETSEGTFQVGWWSDVLCQSDGSFAVAQELQFDFTTDHDSIGITIDFDKINNEYAEEFTITAYDSGLSVIATTSVTGNTDTTYIWQENLPDYRRIVISVTKWGNPYRRARIVEVAFGIVEEYNGDDLIETKVLEELNPTSDEIAANELQFTVDNQNKRFNILNPSGIYNFLQRRQKLLCYMGVEVSPGVFEYMEMGVYYLTEWKSNEGTLTASFVALDLIDILEQTKWRRSTGNSTDLKTLAENILDDAGVEDYDVDTALSSITVDDYIPIVSHREALQYVVVAGQAVMYSDRQGKIIVKQLSDVSSGKEITLNDVYASPEVNLDKLYNRVETNLYNFVAQPSSNIFSDSITISGTEDVWIEFDQPVSPASLSVIVSGGTVNSSTYYVNSVLLNITAAGSVTIDITGQRIDSSNSIYAVEDIIAGEPEVILTVDNILINNSTVAADVSNWILDEKGKRKIYSIDWRQNPAYETGDIVKAYDEFGENLDTRITKQEYDFVGYLSGVTESKGVS